MRLSNGLGLMLLKGQRLYGVQWKPVGFGAATFDNMTCVCWVTTRHSQRTQATEFMKRERFGVLAMRWILIEQRTTFHDCTEAPTGRVIWWSESVNTSMTSRLLKAEKRLAVSCLRSDHTPLSSAANRGCRACTHQPPRKIMLDACLVQHPVISDQVNAGNSKTIVPQSTNV